MLAAGVLFAGQGLGYIRGPANSLMIGQIQWTYDGGGIAIAGLLLMMIARREV